MSSYQNLRENEQRGAAIVNSIVSAARTCNLDKDIKDLPTESDDAKALTQEQRDLVVGKVSMRLPLGRSLSLPLSPTPARRWSARCAGRRHRPSHLPSQSLPSPYVAAF